MRCASSAQPTKLTQKQLQNIYGVILSAADVSMKTLDGRSEDKTVH